MPPTSFLNSTVGEYRLTEFLGAGGMGEVYRAVHSKIGRAAAVKVLTQATQSSGFVERFFNEARIQASLQHPHIATLYDFCEVAGQPCIIMEYVDGQTVAERVAAYGALPLAEAVYIFERVVEAIEYIHSYGIIHRDIKSNNLKISSQGQVKLLDFGIAKAQTSPGITQVGSVIGTLQYLAPELIRGGAADARGDIWALGVLLYEMVTGRVPFEATTVGDLCDKIARASYAPPAQLNPGLPRPISEVIARCLRRNPSERYDATGLLHAVRQLSSVVSKPGLSEAVTASVASSAGRGPKGLPLLVGAAATAVLVVGGIGAFVAFGPSLVTDNDNNTGAVSANADAGLKKRLSSSPSPAAPERVVTITVWDGRADVYRGDEKIGTTPLEYKGRLGEHVVLKLKRDGYEDEPLVFDLTEQRKSIMQAMKKLGQAGP